MYFLLFLVLVYQSIDDMVTDAINKIMLWKHLSKYKQIPVRTLP
jgi:hypothetical protein